MSALLDQFRKSQGLLSAVEAVTDRRAFITLFSTFAAAILVVVLTTAIVAGIGFGKMSAVIGGLGALCAWAVVIIGASATGFLINDTVRGRDQKTIGQAIMLAVATVHRILGVVLMAFLIGLLAVIVICVAVFICKLPGLGPLLYAVVFPICAVAVGVLFYSMVFVLALHGPAIWEGNTVLGTVGILATICRQRLFPVIIQTVLLGLLVSFVAGLILGAIGVGISTTTMISVPILGSGLNMGNPMELFMDMFSGMGGSGAQYTKAGMFGMALLFGCGFTAPLLVAIAGNCIIYANVTENLDTSAVDQKIKETMEAAKEKAEQTRRQLNEAREQLSKPQDAAPSAPVAAAAAACPKCQSPITPGDAFCGDCGQRLA